MSELSLAFSIAQQAVAEDDAGNYQQALALYTDAIQVFLGVARELADPASLEPGEVPQQDLIDEVKSQVASYVSRAEKLKLLIEKGATPKKRTTNSNFGATHAGQAVDIGRPSSPTSPPEPPPPAYSSSPPKSSSSSSKSPAKTAPAYASYFPDMSKSAPPTPPPPTTTDTTSNPVPPPAPRRQSLTSRQSGTSGTSGMSSITAAPNIQAHLKWLLKGGQTLWDSANKAQKAGNNDVAALKFVEAAELFKKAVDLDEDPKRKDLLRKTVEELVKKAESAMPSPAPPAAPSRKGSGKSPAAPSTPSAPAAGLDILSALPSVPKDSPGGPGSPKGGGSGGSGGTSLPRPSAPPKSPSRPRPPPSTSLSTPSGPSRGGGGGGGGGGGAKRGNYTADELKVLRKSSRIGGFLVLPWMDDDPNTLDWGGGPDGESVYSEPRLALSEKQKAHLKGWKRPHELTANPTIIQLISPTTIVQTVVGDCSFVASLTVAANYELRHGNRNGEKLVSQCLYPQDVRGRPMYNPKGKYMVKFNLNGVPRRVEVDDQIPVDSKDVPLCSYSSNRSELWVTLLEKAYLKIMGGYDFPGSNSGVDIHALYGWIPEDRPLDNTFQHDAFWPQFLKFFHAGMALFTISTGALSPETEEAMGLVKYHAYAVLDVQEACGQRLLLLKNPWSRVRWKGPFAAGDKARWTPELQKALNYDMLKSIHKDNGMFWIHWDDAVRYYSSLHISWNPRQFPASTRWHGIINANHIPRSLKYMCHVGNFPQYKLSVSTSSKHPMVKIWLLLSQHLDSPKDVLMADYARESILQGKKTAADRYITLYVFSKSRGNRVYYLEDMAHTGIYRNNAHYLAQVEVPCGTDHTVAVSTFGSYTGEDKQDPPLPFTLSVYSVVPATLHPVETPIRSKTLDYDGEFNGMNSGGPPSQQLWYRNPQFKMTLSKPVPYLFLRLEGDAKLHFNLEIMRVPSPDSRRVDAWSSKASIKSTGQYRPGLCYVEWTDAPVGTYIVVASTFRPGEKTKFNFRVLSSFTDGSLINVSHVPLIAPGTIVETLRGNWTASSAGGEPGQGSYSKNPTIKLTVPKAVTIESIRLRMKYPEQADRASGEMPSSDPCINVALFAGNASLDSGLGGSISHSGTYTNPPAGVLIRGPVNLTPNGVGYVLVPSVYDKGVTGEFVLEVMANGPFALNLA